MNQKTFVDACVVLEIMLDRAKKDKCQQWINEERCQIHISTLTVHLAYHFAEKNRLDPGVVKTRLEPYIFLPVTEQTINLAQRRFTGKDFEDCLQAAAAELGRCNNILTLDKNFAKSSATKLPVVTI